MNTTTEANRMAQLIKLAVNYNQRPSIESVSTDKIVHVWNDGTVSDWNNNFLHKAESIEEAVKWAVAEGYEIHFTES